MIGQPQQQVPRYLGSAREKNTCVWCAGTLDYGGEPRGAFSLSYSILVDNVDRINLYTAEVFHLPPTCP